MSEGQTSLDQKCTFQGCMNRGIPQEGFDFFVCDVCFDEFDREVAKAALTPQAGKGGGA